MLEPRLLLCILQVDHTPSLPVLIQAGRRQKLLEDGRRRAGRDLLGNLLDKTTTTPLDQDAVIEFVRTCIVCFALLCLALICSAVLCLALLCLALFCFALISFAWRCFASLCVDLLCFFALL